MVPVEVCVRGNQIGGWSAPLRVILGGVGIIGQGRVVSPHDRSVQGRADAFVGLCPGDDQVADSALRQDGFELGVVESVAVSFVDRRLRSLLGEFGNEFSPLASGDHPVVGMLHPHDRNIRGSGSVHQQSDVRDDGVTLVRVGHHVVLDIDDEERYLGPVRQGRHDGCLRKITVLAG